MQRGFQGECIVGVGRVGNFLAHYVYAKEKYRLAAHSADTYSPLRGRGSSRNTS